MGKNQKHKKGQKRRKKKQNKSFYSDAIRLPNHYQDLGVSTSANADEIRHRYLQVLRDKPPDQYPEEFEKVRGAYEVLSDPVKRSEYDRTRLLGRSLEDIVGEGYEDIESGSLGHAMKLAREALSYNPDSVKANMLMANVLREQDADSNAVKSIVEHLVDRARSDEEKLDLLLSWARWGIDPSDSLSRIEEVEDRFPDTGSSRTASFKFVCYVALGQYDEAMKTFERLTNVRTKVTSREIEVYLEWLDQVLLLNQKKYIVRVLQRLRKHLAKGMDRFPEWLEIKQQTLSHARQAQHDGDFRRVAAYLQVASFLDPHDIQLVERRLKAMQLLVLGDEIDDFICDPAFSEPLRRTVWSAFARLADIPSNHMPNFDVEDILGELLGYEFGVSPYDNQIEKVEKFFPAIYRTFGDLWDRWEPSKKSKPSNRVDVEELIEQEVWSFLDNE